MGAPRVTPNRSARQRSRADVNPRTRGWQARLRPGAPDADRVAGTAAAAVLSLPVVVDPWGWQSYVTARWLVLAMVCVGAVWLVGPRLTALGSRGAEFVVLLLLLAPVPGLLRAPVILDAIVGDSARRAGYLTHALVVTAFLVGSKVRSQRGLVLRVGVCTGLVVGLLTLSSLLDQPLSASRNHLTGNAGQLGGLALLLCGLAVTVARHDRVPAWRRAAWMATAGCALTVVLTGSHAAVLGLGALLVLIGVGPVRQPVASPRIVRLLPVLATVPIVLAVTWTTQFRSFGSSLQARGDTWLASLQPIIARPLAGWGFEGFRHGFAATVPPEFIASYGDERIQDRAHSIALDVAVSMGLVGLIVALAALVMWYRQIDATDPVSRGLLVSLVASGVFLLAWFPEFEFAAMLAVVAGLTTGRGRRCLDEFAWPRVARTTWTILVVIGLAAVATAGVAMVGDRAFAAAQREMMAAQPSDSDPYDQLVRSALSVPGGTVELLSALEAVRGARLVTTERANLHRAAANLLERSTTDHMRQDDAEWSYVKAEISSGVPELAERAEAGFLRALDLAPNHSLAWRGLGRLRLIQGEPSASEALRAAADLRPTDIGVRYDLMVLAIAEEDSSALMRSVDEACSINPLDRQVRDLLERHALGSLLERCGSDQVGGDS